MTTFSELLPATKTHEHNGIRWTPETGRLTVITGRVRSEYHVREFPADGGRGFHFTKLTPGTDRAAESYDVFCHNPATSGHDSCDCKGFDRHGHCKHVEAVKAILENAFLWNQTEAAAPAAPAPRPASKSVLTDWDRKQEAEYRW